MLRQAALLEARYTFEGVPARGISLFAARGDLEVDFHNEDQTGYLWTWLTEARDPSLIVPDRIVVVGDEDALAMARVVDLIEHENGTIVHIDVLPGTVDAYLEAAARATGSSL